MTRSTITDRTIDLNTDAGAVLWSIVQGEQREFPLSITSLTDITGYTFKAVVIEALNTAKAFSPTAVKAGGVVEELVIRVPLYRGAWNIATLYTYGDVVLYNNKKYIRGAVAASVDTTVPGTTPLWVEHVHNTIYIQFPSTFADAWVPQPSPVKNVFGFFELSIKEPTPAIAFNQTYKPVRGLVESVFSPTDVSEEA
jgi:hypothetical protein